MWFNEGHLDAMAMSAAKFTGICVAAQIGVIIDTKPFPIMYPMTTIKT